MFQGVKVSEITETSQYLTRVEINLLSEYEEKSDTIKDELSMLLDATARDEADPRHQQRKS